MIQRRAQETHCAGCWAGAGGGAWLTTMGGRNALCSSSFCFRALNMASVSTTTNLFTWKPNHTLIKPSNPEQQARRRRNTDLIEHADERGGGAVNYSAVASAEAHGVESAAMELASAGETTHQRDVQPGAPLDRNASFEGIERASGHLSSSPILRYTWNPSATATATAAADEEEEEKTRESEMFFTLYKYKVLWGFAHIPKLLMVLIIM